MTEQREVELSLSFGTWFIISLALWVFAMTGSYIADAIKEAKTCQTPASTR